MTKRKTYTAKFKARLVLEILTEQKSIAQARREYGIKDSVISRWKQEFIERSLQIFEKENNRDERDQRIAELERMIGRLAMELGMSKSIQVLELGIEQKRELAKTLRAQGYPLCVACELLGLARSTYYYQAVERDESDLEDAIEDVTGKFPTYGTRRVSRQLRRSLHQMVVNSALGYLTPAEFERAYRLAQTLVTEESPLINP